MIVKKNLKESNPQFINEMWISVKRIFYLKNKNKNEKNSKKKNKLE